jgi:cytoskeletal protein CcmA (bactofilin family)
VKQRNASQLQRSLPLMNFDGRLLAGLLSAWIAVMGLVASADPAAAAESRPPREVAEDLLDRFEVLPLSEGMILRPRSGREYRVVEITAEGAAVDGERASGGRLARRIEDDRDLELIEELVDLSSEDRRDVLRAVERADDSWPRLSETPVPPEVPVAPEAPEALEGSAIPAVPAIPEPPRPPRRRSHSDAEVAVASHIVVEEDERVEEVVVFAGSITVEGEVERNAVAIGGSIEVNGRVSGDVVAVGGSVELGPHAEVLGEVVSVGGTVDKDPGARVEGKISETAFGSDWKGLRALRHIDKLEDEDDWHFGWKFSPLERFGGFVLSLVKIGLLALLACVALMAARRSVTRSGELAATETWRAGATGLVAQILFVPVLVITVLVLAISVIGIPLLLLVPFALIGLVIAAFVGYAAVALRLGRWVEGRLSWVSKTDVQSVLIGVVTIEMWRLLANLLDWGPLGFVSFLVSAFGFLLVYLVWTVGFGAMLITLFGEGGPFSRRRGRAVMPVVSAAPVPAPAQVPLPSSPESPAAETPEFDDSDPAPR